MSQPEGIVKRWVNDRIKERYGKRARITNTHQGRYGNRGTEDVICCINGLYVGIEVKTEIGHPSALQLHKQKETEEAGGIYEFIFGKDVEKMNEIFGMIDEVLDVRYKAVANG